MILFIPIFLVAWLMVFVADVVLAAVVLVWDWVRR